MGHLLSPRHTLPPNTTCTYYFHGVPTDLVWISFTNYHLQILQPSTASDNVTIGKVSTLIIRKSTDLRKSYSPTSSTERITTSVDHSPTHLGQRRYVRPDQNHLPGIDHYVIVVLNLGADGFVIISGVR